MGGSLGRVFFVFVVGVKNDSSYGTRKKSQRMINSNLDARVLEKHRNSSGRTPRIPGWRVGGNFEIRWLGG